FQDKFMRFPLKARVIIPYGLQRAERHGWEWFPVRISRPENQREYAASIPVNEGTVSNAIAAIARVRPTVGKPIVSGFSQGGGMSFAIALRHPELIAFACPYAGEVPASVFRGVTPPAARPEVHAIQGEADTVVVPREAK